MIDGHSRVGTGSKYVVFLAVYFKGDREDLDNDTYKSLGEAANSILGNVLSVEWV